MMLISSTATPRASEAAADSVAESRASCWALVLCRSQMSSRALSTSAAAACHSSMVDGSGAGASSPVLRLLVRAEPVPVGSSDEPLDSVGGSMVRCISACSMAESRCQAGLASSACNLSR